MPKGFAPYNPLQHGVSVSMLQDWLACRQLARYRADGIRPRRPSMALTYGMVGHDCLQIAHQALADGLRKVPGPERVKGWVRDVRANWVKQMDRADAKSMENIELSLLFADAVLPLYFRFWRKDMFNRKWLNIEGMFKLPIPTPQGPVLMIGRFDAAYEQKKELWLLESKFKSRINEGTLIDTLPMDLQTMTYLLVLLEKTKKVPKGAVYNLVKRPELRQKKGESLIAFAKRCAADVEKRPEFYFCRLELRVTKAELEAFRIELSGLLQEFLAWSAGKGYHYKNPFHCENKYGQCPMLALCSRGEMGGYYQAVQK